MNRLPGCCWTALRNHHDPTLPDHKSVHSNDRFPPFRLHRLTALCLCPTRSLLLSRRAAEDVPETPESFPSHQRRLASQRQRVKASCCLLPFDLPGVIKRRHVLTEVMGGPGGTSVWFWGEIPRVDLPPPPTADVS